MEEASVTNEERAALAGMGSAYLNEPRHWRLRAQLVFGLAGAWLALLVVGRSYALYWLGMEQAADAVAIESLLKLRALSVGAIVIAAYLGLRYAREVKKPLGILLLIFTMNFAGDLLIFYSAGLMALDWRVFLSIALRGITLALAYSVYRQADASPPAPRSLFTGAR